MFLYLTTAFLAAVVLFTTIPAAIHEANRVHILHGRKPNAGIAFVPDLLIFIAIGCLGVCILDQFLGRTIAWVGLAGSSTAILTLSITKSVRSLRSYNKFLEEHYRNLQESSASPQLPRPPGDGSHV
ncbi:hypothetical protein OVA24_15560 [Luteolibacter sp. SL250]|uniref:hypothetical protein n=1 Tax=Luteolibacter sp. SL250 TaxID=2995170 RepID=UPI00226F148D|nr:hypothetical protein [Luteolibacter sp. SL250]WAC18649.1 hypothetical protein OVA24_15560 [Luteolibacter sp. SL250]